MTERELFDYIVLGWILLAVGVFVLLHFISAPYGRHYRSGWGPALPNRIGWFVMEFPALALFWLFFLSGSRWHQDVRILFALLWSVHYGYRSLVYPLLVNRENHIPVSIVAMGVGFNAVNAYLQGRYLGEFALQYPFEYLLDWRFLIGVALFFAGFAIHVYSDALLRRLRRTTGGYAVPRGFLFDYIASPNYFGEIVEWCGWALATFSLPGLAFAIWTAANLMPRARSHRKWYLDKFPEFPRSRKAVIPFLY